VRGRLMFNDNGWVVGGWLGFWSILLVGIGIGMEWGSFWRGWNSMVWCCLMTILFLS